MKKNKVKHKFDILAFLKNSELPFTVYIAVIIALGLALALNLYNPELSLNLFTELLGAAFTLFIIGELLLRSKIKRWKIVREDVDYLISRNINRIRDGIATRAFCFSPKVELKNSNIEKSSDIPQQRGLFLAKLETLETQDILSKIKESELFTDENYDYFNDKADDIWDVLNMKYSEYLEPNLVSSLIELHTNLKDICGHIRQYKKIERFPENKEYYRSIGIKGIGITLKRTLKILNDLKKAGYSVEANLSELEDKDYM